MIEVWGGEETLRGDVAYPSTDIKQTEGSIYGCSRSKGRVHDEGRKTRILDCGQVYRESYLTRSGG